MFWRLGAFCASKGSMAPQIYDGKVVVGSAGGEWVLRGFVAAYDARTGTQRWRWYSTDPNMFSGDSWKRGGGTVWTTPALDMIGGALATAGGLVFVGEGDGHVQRPGCQDGCESLEVPFCRRRGRAGRLLRGRRHAIRRGRRRRKLPIKLRARRRDPHLQTTPLIRGGGAASQPTSRRSDSISACSVNTQNSRS